MIELVDLGQRFGPVVALEGVSLCLAAGERAALVGPSGSGKTTLLRLVAGLDLPTSGEVRLGGELASRPGWGLPPHRRGVGMVFQAPCLWPHLSVAGNVGFGLGRLARRERRQRLEEVLAATGLAGLAHRFPHQLSGGQARRVAIARALAPRPPVLLLDEPLTSLDRDARDELLGLVLASAGASRATLLLVTHSEDEAARLDGPCLRLAEGRLVR